MPVETEWDRERAELLALVMHERKRGDQQVLLKRTAHEWQLKFKAENHRLREALRASAVLYHVSHPHDYTIGGFSECAVRACSDARAALDEQWQK